MTNESQTGRAVGGAGASTVTAPPTNGPLADDPIAALWVPALGRDVPLPETRVFTVGREGAHVVLPHGSVSRAHARAERDGNTLRLTDLDSKNGIAVDGVRVTATTVRAGQLGIKLAQLVVLPLTASMVAARQALAFYLGYAAEVEPVIQGLMADAVACRSFAVFGEQGSEPGRVVDALIAASPRRTANRVDVTARHLPTGVAIRDLAANLRGGVVTVDLAAIADARDPTTKRPEARVWAATLAHPQWEILTCWYAASDDALTPLGDAWSVAPTTVRIPTVATRAAGRELPLLLNHILRSRGVGWTERDMARAELPVEVLAKYQWPGGHAELRTCVDYAIALLADQSHRDAAKMLGIDRSTLARMVKAWRGER